MTWGRDERAHLSPVIGAARRQLRDRDPDDVPVRLRKVVASSARTLPPPLEKTLVEVLVSDDDLRSAVTDQLDGQTLDTVSATFLEDPVAALDLARAATGREADAAQEQALENQRKRIDELERQLAEAKERVSALRNTHAEDLTQQRSADRSARERLAERTRLAEAERDGLQRTVAELEGMRSRLDAEVADLQATLDDERLRRSAAAQAPTRVVSSAGTIPTDPIELGRLLDRLERTARPYRRAEPGDRPSGVAERVTFPPGVTPDSVDAVAHLGDVGAGRIVIDGYNLAGLVVDGDFHRREARDRVVTIAGALRRHAHAPVTVVFDAVDVEGRRRRASDLGVEVVFSQDRLADDEIVDIASGDDERIVVVTNDRELCLRVERRGATVVWSTAVAAWSNH